MSQSVLKTIRQLARCHQAFEALNRAQLRETGLTLAQFDIVATLGNTSGMSFKTLGEKTLITKGTLTGVIDRMQRDGLVWRRTGPKDGRVSIVCLTEKGEQIFARLFPAVADGLTQAVAGMPPADLLSLRNGLAQLAQAFARFEPEAAQSVADHMGKNRLPSHLRSKVA